MKRDPVTLVTPLTVRAHGPKCEWIGHRPLTLPLTLGPLTLPEAGPLIEMAYFFPVGEILEHTPTYTPYSAHSVSV
jgi:hypothetical protein